MKKLYRAVLILSLLMVALVQPAAGTPTSTVNPAVPADHASLTAATFRNQFAAAASDINALWAYVYTNFTGTVSSVGISGANGITVTNSPVTVAGTIDLGLGNITPTTVNGLTLAPQSAGFTILGGTTGKLLTVPLDATISGLNTGDQTTSGTTNRITVTSGGSSPVIDISSLYAGQSSIVNVGTLTSGASGAGFTLDLGASTQSGVLGSTHGGAGSLSGLLKANGAGVVSAAVSASDYAPATSGSSILKASSGGFANAAAGTDYEVPLTFSTGLTRSTNSVSVNTSQNIATLSNLTGNGFVKTSGGAGTLSIDTTSYVPTTTTVNGHALSGNVAVTASDLTTGTLSGALLPDPQPTILGGVESFAAPTHQFLTGIDGFGTPVASQPAYADLTGTPTINTLVPSQSGHSGQFLTTNGTVVSWAAAGGGGGGTTLSALTDVTLTSVVDKNVLMYDAGTGQWINGFSNYADITGTPDLSVYALQTTTVNGHNLSSNVTISASDLSTGVLGSAEGGAGTVNGIMKANGSGTVSAATAGTDYSAGTNALATGILKSTTSTGALTIAVAGDFPTLNQSTTGSAATLTTARAIGGVNFDGSAAITPLNIQPASEVSDTTTFPLFVNAATGTAQEPKYNAAFGYNASTNALTATTFIGALNGNADTVTTNANLTGDVTSSGNATTLATVNSNVGSFGSPTAIPVITLNGKGLATAATTAAVVAPAGTLSGSTLAAGVTGSSLTSVGTLANLTVTNPISGSVTGNAATVTTNANLTGPITSSGNSTTLNASAQAIPSGWTATTQAANDNSTKLATDAYVDGAVSTAVNGLDWKQATGFATTANITGTYLSGVLTYTATGTDTIDGHTLAANDNVLVKNQTTQTQNGAYTVTTAGSVGVSGVLTRRSDFNTSAKIAAGDTFYITGGTANVGTAWSMSNAAFTTLDTDNITFAQVAGPGTYTAGTGLTLTGTAFSVNNSQSIATLSNLTSNGVVTTSGGAGTLGITGTSGSGSVCLTTNCAMTTPDLGTPSALVATNASGTAPSLTAGHVTTNANLTGDATSVGNASTVVKVNGIAYSATAAAHSVEVITSANTTATAKAIPDCTDATGNHLNYTQSTDSFSCGTSVGTVTAVVSVTHQVFTASGTYTPTTGMLYADIICQGGGGAGGGAAASASAQNGGGGGGAGGWSRVRVTAAQIGASKTVTVGAAGTGSTSTGGNGGDTSVGTLCVGKGGTGGGGGSGSTITSAGAGGAGGIAGTGDVTLIGAVGDDGVAATIITVCPIQGGGGGPSPYGGRGTTVANCATGPQTGGAAKANTGSGGGGAESFNNGTAGTGGAGGKGLVDIVEYNSQ